MELEFGFFFVLVFIGMVFLRLSNKKYQGKLFVGLFDLFGGGSFLKFEDFVVTSLFDGIGHMG